MTTTILDGETYTEALQRRYAEEAKTDERMNIIELAKEADIYVAHMNKPMTDKEVRLAFLERFAALVRAEYEAPLKLAEEALNAMLTHMGMDEDEWTKPTFDQSRKTLAAIREALADHIAASGKMVGCAYCDTNFLAGSECGNCGRVTLAEPANTRSTSEYSEPVKQEPVAFKFVRYVDGKEMAEGVTIEREKTLDAAIKKAVALCPNRDKTVLVYAAPVEPVKQEPVAYMFKVKRTLPSSTQLDVFAAIEYHPLPHEDIISKDPLYAAPVSAEAIRADQRQKDAAACYLRANSWKDNAARAAKLCGDAIMAGVQT